MAQRLAIIGFALAVILAIYLFTQQQQALKDAQQAQAAQADSEQQQATSVAMAQDAVSAQKNAENAQATSAAVAQSAGTAQAESDDQRETAVADAKSAQSLSNQLAATATIQSDMIQSAQAEATSEANQRATVEAESTSELSTQQAQIDAQATTQAGFDAALGTATAQVDLAQFALQAAEEDRATALANYWIAATVVAQQSSSQAGSSPATAVPSTQAAPTAIPTLQLLPTAAVAPGTTPPLTETVTTNDKKLSLNYPQGWLAGEVQQGVLLIANSQAIIQRSSSDLQSGELEIEVVALPVTGIRGVSAGAKPEEALTAFRDIYLAQGNNATVGDVATLTIGQYDAARFAGKEGNNGVAVTILDLGNDIVALVFTYTYPGESDQFTQPLNDILATIQYQG